MELGQFVNDDYYIIMAMPLQNHALNYVAVTSRVSIYAVMAEPEIKEVNIAYHEFFSIRIHGAVAHVHSKG